jgi:hypothetical protein
MIGIFMFAIAIIFMNCATGTWLGYGVYQHDVKWTFITVVLVSIPFNFIIFLWYLISSFNPTIEDVILISIAMGYGIIVFLYTYFKIMPEALPEKYHRERLRDSRKEFMGKKRGK